MNPEQDIAATLEAAESISMSNKYKRRGWDLEEDVGEKRGAR